METLIHNLLHITDTALCKKIASIAHIESLHKGDKIIEIGHLQKKILILIQGVVRAYYRDQYQREYTLCFICEPGYPVMVDSYKKTVLCGAHAVTETQLLSLPLDTGLKMIQEYPELTAVYIQMLRRAILFHVEIATVLRGCTALERYMWFREVFPNVDTVASSRHIASFLNVAPETLSRLRAKYCSTNQDYSKMYNIYSEKGFEQVKNDLDIDVPFGK